MAADYSICLGTAGWGVWHSPDSGQSWTRHRAPFPLNSRIQSLVAHPTQPHTVLAGGDTGLMSEPRDQILPVLDKWAELKRQVSA